MGEKWGYNGNMRIAVDRVGRIVIPKPLRDSLGIGPDSELEVLPDGAGIRLEPVRTLARPVTDSDDGLPLLGLIAGVVLSDADVQRTRDDSQR